jgi:hypothetical protein
LVASAVWFIACARGAASTAVATHPGEELARRACASCHLFPEPGVVDQRTWKEQILPRMETRMGVSPPDYSSSPEGELLRSLRIYPDEPMVTQADWDAIHDYYIRTAPVKALPQPPRAEIQIGLPRFKTRFARFRHAPPATTLVRIQPEEKRIYFGDDFAKALTVLDAAGRRVGETRIGNVPIDLNAGPDGLRVTAIGSFQPSERQEAALLHLPRAGDGWGAPRPVVENLPRAAQTVFGDLDGDGLEDFAMCLFGNHRGRFSWFRNAGGGRYEEQVLMEKAGPIRCAIHDFNEDGLPDLGLLAAQEIEAFMIYFGDGKGGFRAETVFQRHPAFGHNYFELADFDGDGRADLLVVNGDNGEYESSLKAYHGLRIYRNLGGGRFEEAWFFPLNGATKAVARDFDQDGDLDIAAISFYPDYVSAPRESFVFLENRGGMDYAPRTFPQCIAGRWVVMDAGDLDGDGDEDIVLGSYIRGPTSTPAFLRETWEKSGPSVVILENTIRP